MTKVSDRVMKRLVALYDRVHAGEGGTTKEEYETVKRLFADMLERYGLTEKDIKSDNKASNDDSLFVLEYTPTCDMLSTKTHACLSVIYQALANYYDIKVVMHNGKFSASFFSEQDIRQSLTELADTVFTKMKACYVLAKVFCTKLSKTDYMLGYAYGCNEAMLNKRNEETTEREKEMLVVVSSVLQLLDKKLDDMGAKEKQNTPKVKDENAFLLGYNDGLLLFKKQLV